MGTSRVVTHTRFDKLSDYLQPGDLLVVNTSPTMAAAVRGAIGPTGVGVHFSSLHEDGNWSVELRRADNTGPVLDRQPGEVVKLAAGFLTLLGPEAGQPDGQVRLWRAAVNVSGTMGRFMRRHGKPIRYAYVQGEWPLAAYQTVFADHSAWPGSAEMPSAARPFTRSLVAGLRRSGVNFASVALHSGVSSLEAHESPRPEPFVVSQETANAVNEARHSGRHVIAVGTTVTRALETVADRDGSVQAGRGWTDLVLGLDRPGRAIDGLITGWHPPEASHLQLLRAALGSEVVARAYAAALDGEYLWHEFGDSSLLFRR